MVTGEEVQEDVCAVQEPQADLRVSTQLLLPTGGSTDQ